MSSMNLCGRREEKWEKVVTVFCVYVIINIQDPPCRGMWPSDPLLHIPPLAISQAAPWLSIPHPLSPVKTSWFSQWCHQELCVCVWVGVGACVWERGRDRWRWMAQCVSQGHEYSALLLTHRSAHSHSAFPTFQTLTAFMNVGLCWRRRTNTFTLGSLTHWALCMQCQPRETAQLRATVSGHSEGPNRASVPLPRVSLNIEICLRLLRELLNMFAAS